MSSRRTLRLDRLIRYKAPRFDLVGDADVGAPQQVAEEIRATVSNAHGRSIEDTDPRALPFLPFDLGRLRDIDLDLDTNQGRTNFDLEYGPPRARRDARKVLWELHPRDYHGRDSLFINGRGLPIGFHWDVKLERGSAFLCMAAEVWHLKKGQHLNVYPDMHSRTTRQGAKKVWPKKK